ncbi:MAG: hypothetical protein ACYTG5_10835 [Planctomycetota bacterium]
MRSSLGAFLLLLSLAFLASSCGTTYPRRVPIGEVFPSVVGTSLNGEEVSFPEVGAGEPLLLLVGYEQDAQFDLDRWLFGLVDAEVKVRVYEVPTIPGLIPRMISGTIDGGMRRGIPSEDWGGVVTIYGDAAQIAEFTGNEDGLTGRILLLDPEGRVVFFHDRGYSVGSLNRLREVLSSL